MSAIQINENLLDEYLTAVEQARQWSPRVISKLETFLRTAGDYDLFKINPYTYAMQQNLDEAEVIELYLRSAKAGIFTMNWSLVCPTCGADVGSFRSLKHVENHFFCNICRVESSAYLDDHIMITFTVNPHVREIIYHNPDSLHIDDYCARYRYSREGKVPGTGKTFPEFMEKYVRDMFDIEPNETKNVTLDVGEGYVLAFDLHSEGGLCITTNKDGKDAPADLSFALRQGEYNYSAEHTYKPGRLAFSIDNQCGVKARMLVLFEPPQDVTREQPNLEFDKFLSGKILLNNSLFNKLFRSDLQVGKEGINVKDITILFTDLKSSTELYEKIGDVEAFSLVNQHFQLLEDIVAAHNGTVIKTIGDAIMATFLNPAEAIDAAIRMNDEIYSFNARGSQDLILKIGIHKGPSIAVTMNNQLDYFGRTVNIASRIQHLAKPEEINITKDIYDYPEISGKLTKFKVDQIQTKLKGIHADFDIYRIYK